MRLICGLLTLLVALPSTVAAATLPTAFIETQVAGGLSSPTAMQFAPDGRLICFVDITPQ